MIVEGFALKIEQALILIPEQRKLNVALFLCLCIIRQPFCRLTTEKGVLTWIKAQ